MGASSSGEDWKELERRHETKPEARSKHLVASLELILPGGDPLAVGSEEPKFQLGQRFQQRMEKEPRGTHSRGERPGDPALGNWMDQIHIWWNPRNSEFGVLA